MKWLAQRKRLKIVTLLVLVGGAVIAYVALQPDDLARYKAQLAARGEELSLARLLPPYSEEAADYHQQLSDAGARLVFSPVPPSGIDLMIKPTNGLARPAWTQPTPAMPIAGTWEDFASQVDASEPAMTELRGLLAVPVRGSSYVPAAYFGSKPKFDLVARRKTSQMFAGAVVNELHRRRLDAALTNVQALIGLARVYDDSGLLVDRMIQVAIAGLAVAATWESLAAPGWTEPQLASLQSDWQRLELGRGFVRTVEMERAFGVACYDQFRTNASDRRDMFRGFGSGQGVAGKLYENVYLPIWAAAWSKGDEQHFLEMMQPLIECTRRDITNGNYHALRAALAEVMRDIKAPQSSLHQLRFPLASMVVPNWEKAVTTLLRYETQRQMTLTAIALKRHQLRHGTLPASLEALTPAFLPALPVDHLGGCPLTYQRMSDHRFRLRSVGNNERDDDGADDDLVWAEPEMPPSSPIPATGR